jgi:hypothetical protein
MRHVSALLFVAGQVPASPSTPPAASAWRNGGAAAGYVMEAEGAKVYPDEVQEAAGPNGDPAMSAASAWLKTSTGWGTR